MSNKELVDVIFDQIKDKQLYIDALKRAAEYAYQNEMVDTNMEMLSIREVAEKYEFYTDDREKQETLKHCEWETKEEWIKNKIQEWLDPTLGW